MEQKRLDRRTLYVALTRAQKELYITSQELKGLAGEIKDITKNTMQSELNFKFSNFNGFNI